MNSGVDQFGRSTNTSKKITEEKSQRILEALSDIKLQLQNEEIAPQELEENSLKIKETKKDKSHDLDFKNLQQKIENLEKKINQIFKNLENKSNENFIEDHKDRDEEISIFHQFQKNTDLKTSKSLTIINNPYYQKKKISFFQIFFRAIVLTIICTAIILYAKNIPLSKFIIEIENLF